MRTGRYLGKGNFSAVVFLAVTLFFITGCATTSETGRFYLDPSDGDRSVFAHEGLTVSSSYLDQDELFRYLMDSGREALARGTRELPLSTFHLEVVNESGSEVVVDPASIRLVTGTGPIQGTMTYAHLYMALPRGEGRQAVLQELHGVVFDRPVTISPGGREDGLIFFNRPEKVSGEVALVLEGLYLGGAQLKAVLAFEAVPLEK